MSRFRFSLNDLLELRRRELRQLEVRAAAEAAHAAAARRAHQGLLAQLGTDAATAIRRPDSWLLFQQSADAARLLAADSLQRAAAHDAAGQLLQGERAAKQTEVDALETLLEQELLEHRRREQRSEERRHDELILRQWRLNEHTTSEPAASDG